MTWTDGLETIAALDELRREPAALLRRADESRRSGILNWLGHRRRL
jgi:hypothetical protein